MMTEQEIMEFARAEFYWLHAHPELSYEEFETTARLRAAFERFGIRVLDVPLETGLVAAVGTGEKPIVALRTDIDALPVTEATDLPYRSLTEGKMHACGHDFHMAAVLAAALLLKEREAALEGTVYIVCQPAEEAPGGARCVLDTGVLDGVTAIFGIHTRPLYPVGTFGLCTGGMMASTDKFEIAFTGVGTHAAQPDRGCDPIVMAAQFESLVDPFVIMFSVPFAFSGVFFGLLVTQIPLDTMSFIGMIMLIGIVVKNGIVLIDYIRLCRERGMGISLAVTTSGRSRLRPVLMTTMTTVLGMVPMAMGIGEGSEMWQSMGITVAWGLSISTLVTLVLIPTLYAALEGRRVHRARRQLEKKIARRKKLSSSPSSH